MGELNMLNINNLEFFEFNNINVRLLNVIDPFFSLLVGLNFPVTQIYFPVVSLLNRETG